MTVTQEIEGVLARLGIALIDHIIVADGEVYSMIEHGDFTSTLFHGIGKTGLREEEQWDGQWL